MTIRTRLAALALAAVLLLAPVPAAHAAGPHMDPNGWAATNDAGPGMDPNGWAANGDAGPHMDPDGAR